MTEDCVEVPSTWNEVMLLSYFVIFNGDILQGGYRILEDGNVVFVVEVLVETRYSVLTVRYGCTGSVVV